MESPRGLCELIVSIRPDNEELAGQLHLCDGREKRLEQGGNRGGVRTASCPSFFSSPMTFTSTFSSTRMRMMGRTEGGMAAVFHGVAGELQSGLDMVPGQARESGFDLDEGVPSLQ